ncbi:MAG TPA: hypothetical protein GX505_05210 [Clostridiales bacterium]|nr:hypothetical protein [Clostridiales bacterium]
MISFRKMKLGDLENIYKDTEIRPLITVTPKGKKFAVVIELDEQIIGGASGYVENNAAIAQSVIVKESDQKHLYKDGLIRSLIHFLELDGIELLFINDIDPLYQIIGFHELQGNEDFLSNLGDEANNDIKINHTLWINLKDFFKH